MASIWARDRQGRFYLLLGLTGLIAIAVGFSTTYVIPMAERRLEVPPIVHLHGLGALSWVLLLVVQASLVRSGNTKLHMTMGRAGLPLATFIWLSGIATAVWAAKRDLPAQGSAATSSLLGTVNGLTLFLLLVIAAVLLRRRPDSHKRLILLATIHVLWPAFFRWRHLLPMIPRPDIWLALVAPYSLIIVAGLRDKLKYGRVHPVWLIVGPALVIEQSIELATFDTWPWKQVGQSLYAYLS